MIIIDSVINDDYNLSLSVCWWLFTISVNLTSYCVYLGFIVNQGLYMKSCKCCHLFLRNYCTTLAKKRIFELQAISSVSSNSPTIQQNS